MLGIQGILLIRGMSWELKNREFQNREFQGMALGQVFQYLKPFKSVQLVLNYQLQLRENNFLLSNMYLFRFEKIFYLNLRRFSGFRNRELKSRFDYTSPTEI